MLANCSIDFRDDLTASEMEKTIARLDNEIKQKFPNVKRVFIEAESMFSNNTGQPGAE